MHRAPLHPRTPREPTWEIAHLFPAQGEWSEAEYLALTTNRLVEFSDGHLEVLPVPTTSHQLLVAFFFQSLSALVAARGLGTVLFAPLRVRLWPGKYREPDVVMMLAEHAGGIGEQFWEGADLVLEVISDDDRRRDLETKRTEYARAGIPEYWIVDPGEASVTVLRLSGKRYVVHGEYGKGAVAESALLPGFGVDVAQALAHGKVALRKKRNRGSRRPRREPER
jgi:Uma2 family endonuclease